jgi:ribonuclease HIII
MVEPPLPAFPFDLAREARLRQVLDAYGYALREPPPPYARLEAAGEGVRLTLYASGKLLLQGKRAREVQGELAAFGLLDPLPAGAAAGAGGGAAAPPPPLIGSDETGKGDYFGPLAVAAASVLARAEFLKKLAELSDRSGIVLEKGASSRVVEAARRFVARHGKEKLREVAKLHFQTTAQVLGS